jgi:hypothetical protein
MHKYRVIEHRPGQDWLLLEGGVGRYHWARVLGEPPRVGDLLSGSRPHLGFGLLSSARSRQTVRVMFEAINGVEVGPRPHWTAEPSSSGRAGRVG